MEPENKRSRLRLRRQPRLNYEIGLSDRSDGNTSSSDPESIDSDAPLTLLKRRRPVGCSWTLASPVSPLLEDNCAQIKRPRPKKRIRRDLTTKSLRAQQDAAKCVGHVVKNDTDEDDPMPMSMHQNLRPRLDVCIDRVGASDKRLIVVEELSPTPAPMLTPPDSTRASSSRIDFKTEMDRMRVSSKPLQFVFQRRSKSWDKKVSPPQSIGTAEDLFFHAMCNGIAMRSTTRLQVSFGGELYYLCKDNEEYFDSFVGEVRDRIKDNNNAEMKYPRVEPYE